MSQTRVVEETRSSQRRFGGWRGIVLVAVSFMASMVGTTLPTPLYPLYADRLGFGELVTTLVFAAYAVGVMAALLVFGRWSDELGRRPMVLGGLALSALAAGAFLMPLALTWLFVGRLLSGLSAGVLTGAGTAYIVDLAPAAQRGRASLVAAVVNMAGLGAGPLLAGVLAQYAPAPTRLPFLVDLALVALGVVCVVLVREPVRRSRAPRLSPRRLRVPEDARPVFVRSAIAGFAGFAVTGLFTAVSPAFLGQVLHLDGSALVGLVVAVVFAGSVVGQLASTPLGPRRALPLGCVLLVGGMVLIAAGLLAPSLALLVGGAAVAGLGQGTSFRSGLGAISAAAPESLRGEVTSTFFFTLYIGISIPVIGEGALAGAVGLVSAGVVFSVLVALLAAAALVSLLRSRRGA